ncbi:MAG TPA: CsbD family protein [Hyphomicrobium sp.]|nr:CsbD family protein [Hyphomicrobium sp.]
MITGDEKLRADGAADKVEGKVQKAAGKVKDAARDALKH